MFEYGGYLGLFLAAFGAATLLPMQSEAVLGGLLISSVFPQPSCWWWPPQATYSDRL
jgi:membrane protein YqaA with SNARE-associated domain